LFLRSTNRKKDGKDHRYFSLVENQRVGADKTVQRTVLYLGEINDQQQASWRKTLAVFDEEKQQFTELSLFPEDRPLPEDAVDSIQVKLSGLELRRPRPFGNCWLASELWHQLGLSEFWRERLPEGRESVSWEKVLRLLVVNRLLEPGSEFRVHRHWFVESAMDALLEENPKAKRGYSRDSRPDCLQVVIALVVTPDGFPLAYEVMDGNTSEHKTLRPFLEHIENTYGKARRVWVMDRGIPTEASLREMREPGREMFYLVGTPKGRINKHEKKWLDLPWQKVRESVQVKLYQHEGELYVLARSDGRQAKEVAMRRKRLARLLRKLRAMRRSLPNRDQLLLRIGAAKKEAGRAFGFVKIRMPLAQETVTRESFSFRVEKSKLQKAQQRDGHYLLRSNLTAEDPAVLWTRYVQLTQIEAVFRSLKNDLGIRPIYHRLEKRVDAHILIAFLAYCLQVTLKNRLQIHAPGLTPTAVLEKLGTIQMIDVWIPTRDGRWLILPRHTQPAKDLQLLLEQIQLNLPPQPPPRITAAALPTANRSDAQPNLW
jgi:transposase